MKNKTYKNHVSRIQGYLNQVCRELENRSNNSGILLWYNLTGEDRFRIQVPDSTNLEEIFHLQIRPDTDHVQSDEVDVLVFINREYEILSIHTSEFLMSTVDPWQDFTLDSVKYDLLYDVISEILLPFLEDTD